jgi:hypothetical protein
MEFLFVLLKIIVKLILVVEQIIIKNYFLEQFYLIKMIYSLNTFRSHIKELSYSRKYIRFSFSKNRLHHRTECSICQLRTISIRPSLRSRALTRCYHR